MRRADRLFHIVQLLRRHRLTTAARLAERLEVSERTIYRDIRDLQASGVPVEGEAGVGYRLGKNFELPPLMFSVDEVRALVLGARMVETWADDELRQAARRAIDKVHVALPPPLRKSMDDTALFALRFRSSGEVRERMGVMRRAVEEHAVLELDYADGDGVETTRRVRPLGLYFWGPTWTLGAWCELRGDYRSFRLDRVHRVEATGQSFAYASPYTREDYVKAVNEDH